MSSCSVCRRAIERSDGDQTGTTQQLTREDERGPDNPALTAKCRQRVGRDHRQLEEHVEVEDSPSRTSRSNRAQRTINAANSRPDSRDTIACTSAARSTPSDTSAITTPSASALSRMPTPAGHPPATTPTDPSAATRNARTTSNEKAPATVATAAHPTTGRRPSNSARTAAAIHSSASGATRSVTFEHRRQCRSQRGQLLRPYPAPPRRRARPIPPRCLARSLPPRRFGTGQVIKVDAAMSSIHPIHQGQQ